MFIPGEWGTFICQISQKQTLPFVYLINNQIKNQISKLTLNWLSWECNILHNVLYIHIIIYHTKYDTLWYPLLLSHVLPKSTLNQFSYLHHPTHWIVSSSPLSCSCEEVHTLHQIPFTQDKVTSPDTLDTAMGAGGQHSYCMACPAILQAATSQLFVNVWMVLVVLRSHNQPPAGALNWTLFCLLQFPGLIWQSVWGKPQVTVANYTSGNTRF